MTSLDDRPAGQRRVQELVDLVLGRERMAFDGDGPDEDTTTGQNAAVRHCGVSCGCRLGSPVPCGADVALLIPLGAALGTTDELATLVRHGPLEPDLTDAILHSAPRIRPVWVDEHGVPVATGDRVTVPARHDRHDRHAVRHALLDLAAQPPPEWRVPRHPDDHPPAAVKSKTPPPSGTEERPEPPTAQSRARRRPYVLARPHQPGTPGPYRVPARLGRLREVRAPRCEWPGCGVAASRCDLDHDLAWPNDPTCGCNLGPLCRRHHQLKQALMTKTRQQQSAVAWTDPTGRHWTSPAPHPAPAVPVRQPSALTVTAEQLFGPDEDVDDDDTDPIRLEFRAADRDGDEPHSDADADRTATAVESDTGWGLALDDPYRWAA